MYFDKFKVVTVSSNTNSFGLFGVIITTKSGHAFEVAMSYFNVPKKGDLIDGSLTDQHNLYALGNRGYEIPRKLPAPPPELLNKLFN